MRKITMLAFLSFCTIGFSQSNEIKAPTNLTDQSVELPAAYHNNSATTLSENSGLVSDGQRDPNQIVPFTGTYYSNMAPNAVLYDNGPYWNTPGTPNVSLLQTSLGMNSLGSGAQFGANNSVADDVIFTENVEVTSIDVFAYQTGETAPSITAVYLQVWDGDPSTGTANVIWGDLTTDIIEDAVYADANRASETNPGDTSRQIQRVTALTTGLTLSAGTTYWIHYSFEGTGASGPWAPPIAILGETTTGNALQYQGAISDWVALEDSGTFTPQGLPFVMYGEVLGVADNNLGGFNYYPNPTNEVIYLKATKNIESVDVYNLLGQKVLANTIDATSSHINLSGLTTGSYIMKVSVDGKTGSYKIMKN